MGDLESLPFKVFSCALRFDGTEGSGGGRLFLSDDILTIQAEPPAADPFDISFLLQLSQHAIFAYPIFAPLSYFRAKDYGNRRLAASDRKARLAWKP